MAAHDDSCPVNRISIRQAITARRWCVTVRGKVVYKGTFTTIVSSLSFSTPVIVVDAQAVESKLGADQLRIQLGYPTAEFFKGEDPRADRRIREALRADGKLTEAVAAALAAAASSSAQPPSRQIGLGEAQTIRSTILNENREVQVALPETYGRTAIEGLAAALKTADPAAVPAWSYVDMKDEDHSSTPQRSLYNALEARYAEWRFPFFEDQAELDRAGGLKGLETHYERFSKRFGYTSPPPEARLIQIARIYIAAERHDEAIQLSDAYTVQYPAMAEGLVNQVGYDQLRRGQVERAVRTFKKNAETFPASPNVHDSLGDAYCRAGDAASGRRSYQQAARVAATRSPPHPRLAWYQEKASKECAAAP